MAANKPQVLISSCLIDNRYRTFKVVKVGKKTNNDLLRNDLVCVREREGERKKEMGFV